MSEIRIGRVAPENPTGLKPVKGYNRAAGQSMAEIFEANGVDPKALKRNLTPKLQDVSGRDLLNQQITAKGGNRPQFGGKTVKVGDQFVSQTAQETKAIAEVSQKGRQVKAQVEQALSQPTVITANGIDANLGIGREVKSAQGAMGTFIKNDVEKALSQPTVISADAIEKQLGIGREVKSAQESIGAFVKNDVEKALSKPTVISADGINAGLGIGKEVKSAQESMGAFIKNDVEKALSKPTVISADGINAGLGIGKPVKSAQASMGVFIKNDIENLTKDAGKITAEGIEKQLGLGKIPLSAGESAEVFRQSGLGEVVEETTTKPGFWGKIGNFFKSKGGKIALIGLAVAAVAAIGYGIFKSCSSDKSTAVGKTDETNPNPAPNKPEEKDSTNVATKPEEKEDTTNVAPLPAENDDDIKPIGINPAVPDKPEKVDEDKNPAPNANEDPNFYTVKDGDCVWNIAKAHLKDIHKDEDNYKVTNKETAKHTKEIMKWNKLHFEADGYHVMIHTGDVLRLTAPEEEEQQAEEAKNKEK